MGSVSKITSKGQTTIPLEVRDYLQLSAGDRIRYEFLDGKVVIIPQNRSALSLAGILYDPSRKPVSIEDMEDAIGEGIVEDYERSLDRR
jgi:antitoxin PrlF